MESESTPIVPAQRLLQVATALADGAAEVHAELRHLDPATRAAVLDLVTGQVGRIVSLWAELVREVVTPEGPVVPQWTAPGTSGPAEPAPAAPGPAPDGRDRLVAVPEPAASAQDGDPWAARRAIPPPMRAVRESEPDSGVHDEGEPERNPRPVPMAGAGAYPDPMSRDELTGVLNRPAGIAALHREVERCRRSRAPLVLGYMNVDGMRVVNERHGPRAGDELLRKVTAALRATLRSYDVILRLGGDEFLFSLPGADGATAEQRFRDFTVLLGKEAPGASASVGFAELSDDDTVDDLIARADQALLARRPRRRVP